MAKTYITTDNSRGNMVNVSSPTFAHIRGYDVGVRVNAGKDGTMFDVFSTAGTNGHSSDKLIGTITLRDGQVIFIPDPA